MKICSPSVVVLHECFGALPGHKGRHRKPYRVKCPVCGRKIMSKITIDDQDGCVIHTIPPHKVRYWWKKKK